MHLCPNLSEAIELTDRRTDDIKATRVVMITGAKSYRQITVLNRLLISLSPGAPFTNMN